MTYRGRFAPSPTGPLHFGSLVTAVASYLDAKKSGGVWLVRIEDIDPPREAPGARDAILHTLMKHALQWDEPPALQSHRGVHYEHALTSLIAQRKAYYCTCTRSQIAAHGLRAKDGGWIYPGTCRTLDNAAAGAIRLRLGAGATEFVDQLQGAIKEDIQASYGEVVLRRADGLFAYQLAVVVDDYLQGISHVVRGSDLLDSTTRQIDLQQQLGYASPNYMHIPIAVDDQGEKLSKQTYAKAIDDQTPTHNLWQSLQFLRQNPPAALRHAAPDVLLRWAVAHWTPEVLNGIQHLSCTNNLPSSAANSHSA